MAKKSSKRTLWILLTLLVVFVATGLIGRAAGWFEAETGTAVDIAEAQRRTLTQLVSASGIIRPEVEVILSPDVSGEIIELPVKEGDFVNQGDLLLRIRPDLYEARIDEIQAGLLNARAREQQALASKLRAEVNYESQRQLYERELIPRMEYITAKTQFEAEEANHNAARYTVQSVEAQLRRAREELRQTVIRAPMTGTISQLNVERGERVVGSVQMSGTEILRIARMEQMEVEVRVNENDIMNVAVNDTARVLVDSYPGQTIQGIVTEIANSATRRGEGTTEQVSEYVVKIRIVTPHNVEASALTMQQRASLEVTALNQPPYLKPGMSASVDIETQTEVNVVAVPIQSVTVRDFADLNREQDDTASEDEISVEQVAEQSGSRVRREDIRRVVFVVEEGKAKMVEVETGINDDQFIHILRGLDEGAAIVTGSYRVLSRQLSDGDVLKVND